MRLPHPALDRVGEQCLQVPAHVQESRCTRSAVEIFVGTANRQIGMGAAQVDRHRTGCMAQIPEDECAFAMGQFGDSGHVISIGALKNRVAQG